MLGGEVCIWGEFVDATNLDARFWPRASTVGEALWFDPGNAANLTDAAARLQAHACRLMARGISAEPPNGPSYCPVEWATAYAPPWAGRARADI